MHARPPHKPNGAPPQHLNQRAFQPQPSPSATHVLPERTNEYDPALVQQLLGGGTGGGGVLRGRQLGKTAHCILQALHAGGQVRGTAPPNSWAP